MLQPSASGEQSSHSSTETNNMQKSSNIAYIYINYVIPKISHSSTETENRSNMNLFHLNHP